MAEEVIDDDPELRAYENIALQKEVRDRFPEQALDVVQSG
jgi:hypothetical protein